MSDQYAGEGCPNCERVGAQTETDGRLRCETADCRVTQFEPEGTA